MDKTAEMAETGHRNKVVITLCDLLDLNLLVAGSVRKLPNLVGRGVLLDNVLTLSRLLIKLIQAVYQDPEWAIHDQAHENLGELLKKKVSEDNCLTKLEDIIPIMSADVSQWEPEHVDAYDKFLRAINDSTQDHLKTMLRDFTG